MTEIQTDYPTSLSIDYPDRPLNMLCFRQNLPRNRHRVREKTRAEILDS